MTVRLHFKFKFGAGTVKKSVPFQQKKKEKKLKRNGKVETVQVGAGLTGIHERVQPIKKPTILGKIDGSLI